MGSHFSISSAVFLKLQVSEAALQVLLRKRSQREAAEVSDMPFPTKNKSYLEFGYSSFPEDGVAVNPTWIT